MSPPSSRPPDSTPSAPETGGEPGDRPGEPGEPEELPLFREEALQEYERSHRDGGLLQISPRWTRVTYWILTACFAAALLYTILARRTEYATGPAVIRRIDPVECTALLPGTVERVDVMPGQEVTAGQVLLRFHAETERTELDELELEFDLQLVRLLRDPTDEAARRTLGGLRAAIARSQARLDQRVLRSPADGVVQDVRVRPGQYVGSGEHLMSLAAGARRHELIAFLPGRFRPLLEAGQPVRLEVTGFSHAYVDLEVDRVAEEVVGPNAARRFLGAGVGDAIPIAGPVVLVRAALPEETFRAGGDAHPFHGGMQGIAEVGVRRKNLIVTLIPGLERVVEALRG